MIELAVICAALVALQAWTMADRRRERQEVAAERRDLLLRIQAPQTAVALDWNEQLDHESPRAVIPDLDEDYWPTKEELAELAAKAEVNGGD